MRLRGRTDKTQHAIVDALCGIGAVVIATSRLGQGFPDLVVGFRRHWYLLECKSLHGRFTQDEDDFRLMCVVSELPYVVVHSSEEALHAVGATK